MWFAWPIPSVNFCIIFATCWSLGGQACWKLLGWRSSNKKSLYGSVPTPFSDPLCESFNRVIASIFAYLWPSRCYNQIWWFLPASSYILVAGSTFYFVLVHIFEKVLPSLERHLCHSPVFPSLVESWRYPVFSVLFTPSLVPIQCCHSWTPYQVTRSGLG